jgi:uncharacterized membrane protein HdeD (DUF308 family)
MTPHDPRAGLEFVRRQWGWYLALGVLLIVLGVVALGYPFVTTLAAVQILGWLLIFSGIVQGVVAFQVRNWRGFLLHLLAGLLELVIGVTVVQRLVAAAEFLTYLLTIYLVVGGVFRMVAAIVLRFPGGGWVALGGLVSAVLGLALTAQWPSSAAWFIGTCVGVDLVFHGSSWIAFGLGLRQLGDLPNGSDATAAT